MAPVGIFDSGVGGLSVLAEFRKLEAEHPLIYVADQAMAPYGERSLDEVRDRSVAISDYLVARGCEVVVVACNSASAAALHHLRAVFSDVRFVGMEPAVKPAATLSERGIIGVLATDATFQGELYASVVDRHANGTTVIEQACPGLADSIERLGPEAPETGTLVSRYVTPLRQAGVDTIVLGCTHYPFVLPAIEQAAGERVRVIDPAPAVARQMLRMIGELETGGGTEYLTTGDAELFSAQIGSLVGDQAQAASVLIRGNQRIRVVVADLTRLPVDAIVNAANVHLQHGGGVAGAIVRAGGMVIQEESDRWVADHGPLPVGGAAVTSAGSLPAKSVIHVAGPVYREGQDNERLLRAAVSGALETARRIGARTVAIPAISAGIYGYPADLATGVITGEVRHWLGNNDASIDEVVLVGLSRSMASHFWAGLTT